MSVKALAGEKQTFLVDREPRPETLAALGRKSFTSAVDRLCVETQSFCLYGTERANDHIEQRYARFFAGDSIGVADNQLSTMLTGSVHSSFVGRKEYAMQFRTFTTTLRLFTETQ
jgi:hypothetical protein